MRILFLSADYPFYENWVYSQHPGLELKSYREQEKTIEDHLFAIFNLSSKHMKRLGHDAWDVHMNYETLQKTWAKESGVAWRKWSKSKLVMRRGVIPWVRTTRHSDWFEQILKAQLQHFSPDIVYIHDLHCIPPDLLSALRPSIKRLVGQIASPVPADLPYELFDLVLSSLPNLVAHFRSKGVNAELLRLAFERDHLRHVPECQKDIGVSFIGTLGGTHSARTELLGYLAERVPLQCWGLGAHQLSDSDPLKKCHRGMAWGKDMYQILRRSKLTLNIHLDMAGPHANNMRLYESTGVGAPLVTDFKEDLHEIFAPDEEVISFRDKEDCLEKIRFYLAHDAEREAIGHAGQQRTLRDHTYDTRMADLSRLLQRHLPIGR